MSDAPQDLRHLESAAEQAPLDTRAWLALDAGLASAGRHDDRVRRAAERGELLADRPEGVAELVRAASIAADAVKDLRRARELIERALMLDPRSEHAREALHRVLGLSGAHQELAESLEAWALEAEPELAAVLLAEAADRYVGALGNPSRAALCLLRAFHLAPARRESVVQARELLIAAGENRAALELLLDERQAFGAEGLANAFADLADRLSAWPIDAPLARQAVAAALSVDSEHAKAREIEARLDHTAQGWADEVRTLRQQTPGERDRQKAAAMQLRVAQLHAIYDDSPGRDGRIRQAHAKSQLLNPGMRELREHLQRVARESGDDLELLKELEGMAADAKDRTTQSDLWINVGMLRLSHRSDEAGALEAWARAAALDPVRSTASQLAAEVHLTHQRLAEAIALWEAHAAATASVRHQASAHLSIARAAAPVAEHAAKARTHVLAALRVDPISRDEAARYGSLFESAPGSEQAEFFERTLAPTVAGPARAARLTQIAELRSAEAGKALSEANLWARALLLDPGSETIASRLVAVAAKAGAWRLAARALRVASDAAGNASARSLWIQLAPIHEEQLDESALALALYRRAQEQKPAPELEQAIARLSTSGPAVHEPDEAVEKRIEGETNPQVKRSLLEQLAAKQGRPDGDRAYAVRLYQRMLELDALDGSTWERLFSVARELGQWDTALTAADRLIALGSDDAPRWRLEQADMLGRHLGKTTEAVEALLALLESLPQRAAALARLRTYLDEGVEAERISRATLPYLREQEEYPGLAAALEVVLRQEKNPEQREALQLELAEVQAHHLVDHRAATTVLVDALRESPGSARLATELDRLARESGTAAVIAGRFLEMSRQVSQPEVAADLALHAAELANSVQRDDIAGDALARALEMHPHHPGALQAQLELFRRSGRAVEHEALLRAQLTTASEEERAPILLELAEVLEKLTRHGEAAEVLERALAAGADEESTLVKTERAFQASRRFQDLERILTRQLRLAESQGDTEKVARIGLRRTRILEASLGDRAGAMQGYADILAQRPSDPEAMTSLEGMLTDPELRERAARVLIPAYEVLKEHRKLVHALEVVSEAAAETNEKVAALKRAAQVYGNELRQPDLAFAQYARALRLSAGDAALRLAARRAAEEADQIEMFAEVIGECAELASGANAIPLHRELAEVCERRLGNRERAVTAYQRVLVIDPQNLDALRGLHRLHRASGAFAELAKTCRLLSDVVYDDHEKASLLREAGMLFEGQLADPDSAAGVFRRLAELDPLDKDAAAALDRLYEKLGRPQDLAFALELRRAQEGNSPQGREFTFRLADLKRAQLGDLTAALLLFEQLLAADPAHVGTRSALEAWVRAGAPDAGEALKLLDPVLEKAGDHPRRIALREALIKGSGAEVKARLYSEIRAIYQRDLAQPDMAFMSACRAFADGVDRAALEPELEKLARETNAFEELSEVYEDALASAEDEAQAEAFGRRAAAIRSQLGQVERSIELWKVLLDKKPGDREALDALTRLYEKSQNATNLAGLYRQKAQLAATPEERVQLLLQSAAARDQMADEVGAVETIREALALDAKNLKAWQLLDAIYPRLKRPQEHAEVLRALADLTTAAARKSYLLRRAALLEKEGEAHEAVDGYGAVLAEFKGEPVAVGGLERLFSAEGLKVQVAGLLEPIYRTLGDTRRLADVLEAKLVTATRDERRPLLAEVAALREALGQKPLAFALKLRAFRDDPGNLTLRDELERLANDTSSFEELASAYHDEIDRGAHPELSQGLYRSLAVLYAERLGAHDQAAQAYEAVAKLDPADTKVLENLARLYRRLNQLPELATVYKRQIEREENARKKRDLLYELGTLCEEKLADPTGAIFAYQLQLQQEPNDINAMTALHRLYQGTERWDELAHLMEREAELAQEQGKSEEALDITVRLGRLRLTRLQDPRGAFDLFRTVLGLKRGHAGAVSALEDMAKGEGPLRTEAALALEPVFSDGGDHQKLVQVLESRAASAPAAEKGLLLRRVAEVYGGALGAPEMAFMAATRALRELPDDVECLNAALEYVDPSGMHEELVELLGEVLARATTDEARAALYRAQAQMCRGPLKDPRRASEAYLHLLEVSPTDAEAIEQLTSLLRDQGDFETLLEIFRRKLAIAENDDQRATLLLRMAEMQDDKMRDPAAAMATLHRLLQEVRPDDRAALSRLDALCLKQERWVELADVLQRQIALSEGKEAATALQLKLRLAVLRETRLQDRSGALELYAEVLAVRPDHDDVIKRLEDMLSKEPSLDEAAAALEASYRHMGNVARLSQLLETRAANAVDSFDKKRIFIELAEIRAERQNRPDLAFMALCRAFREDPSDAVLRRSLERTAVSAESEEELAALYEEELPRVRDEVAASDIAYRTAVLLETKLEQPEDALKYYEQALALDPEQGAQALPALDRYYRASESWDSLVEVLRRAVEVTTEPREKVLQLQSLAQLLDQKRNAPDQAAEAYEQILTLDPKSMPALRGLEKLYDSAQYWDKLYRILESQRDVAPPAERERILARMAEVASHGLSNSAQSIGLYQQVLEKNPRNDAAFLALEGLYEDANRWDDLVDLVRRKLGFTVDPREIVRLNDKLGRALAEHLEKPDEAIIAFKAVLDRDPRHRRALEHLRDLYEAQAKTEDLVTMLRRLIPVQDDAAGVKQVRLKLGEVLAAANRRDEALDAVRRVLDAEGPTESELHRAEELFQSMGAYTDSVKAMELRASLLEQKGDREGAITTLFSVAEVQTVQLKKREQSLGAYEHILAIDPKNRLAFDQLRSVSRDVADWRRYTTATDRFLPGVESVEEKLELMRENAQLQVEKLGQKDLAFLTYCRAFRSAPMDAEIREALSVLAGETESWDVLANVYEEAAEAAPKGPVAETLYAELARIQNEHLDEPEDAEASLRKILEFDPANHTALDALGSLHSNRGQDSEYIASLEQKLEVTPAIDDRKVVLREIARVYDEKQHQPGEAISTLQRALALEPDRGTLEVLCALLRREKLWLDLTQQLVRARDLAAHPAERSELQFQVAEVYGKQLNDDEAAVAGYRQALEFDPTHRESISALEQLYTKLDRSAELLQVYNQQLEFVQDPHERVRLLFKAATIWEDKFQNLTNADLCLHQVLELDGRNLQAIKGLARLKRALNKWDELVQVYERHLALTVGGPVGEQVDLLLAQGDVWYQKLSRVDRAAEVYSQALTLDPRSAQAMHSLGVLYERSGNWPFALEMLSREASVNRGQGAVDLYHRMGKINEDMLLDGAAAKSAYQLALEIDPAYLPSLRQLKGIFQLEKDGEGFVQTYIQEAKATLEGEEKSLAWIGVADFYREQREDRDQAATYYEEALKALPDALGAARPLADIYVARESWAKAEEMLDIVGVKLGAAGVDDPEAARDLCRQIYRLGYVCEKLGKSKKALEAYRRAYELDATYLPALEGLGNLLVAAEEYEEANKVYQTILLQHKDDLTDLEVVEIYWQLGEICLKTKQNERALNFFEKALAIDPGHEASQRAMVVLAEEMGQYDKALSFRRKLVEVLEGDEYFQMQSAIAKLCRDKLHDPFGAIDAFNAALKTRPDHLATLDQLLAMYRDTHQGAKAVEMLERILVHADVEKDVQNRKKGYFALGETLRDEIKDDDRAIAAFNQCLDLDPKYVQAFSAIENLLAAKKRWPDLEANYGAMIKRLPKTEDTHAARMALWRTLADLYLRVLKNPAAAMMALEVVAKSSPDDVATLEQFADLAAQAPGGDEKAIEAYRQALPQTANPGKVASALARLHALRKEYDEGFVAAQVVVHLLGEGGAEEREILTKLTPYAKRREQAQKTMTDRMWTELLFHPKVKGPLGEIFALLQTQAGHLYARRVGDFGIDPRKHKIDLATAEELAMNTYKYVLKTLNMESMVELDSPFLVAKRAQMRGATGQTPPDGDVFLELCHTVPLAVKAGGALFKQTSQKELQFHIAKTLAFCRPELTLARLLPIERLEAVFQGALVLVAPTFRVTADPRLVEQERKNLERTLTQPSGQALARLVRGYLKVQSLGDVRAFIEGAELTANRAGTLLAGNVEAAKAVIEKDPGHAAKLPVRSRIRDLMVFCLSPGYTQLREALAINVEVVIPGRQPQAPR